MNNGYYHILSRGNDWSSFSFYAQGMHDSIIKYPNPGYLELSGSQGERQRIFRDYVLE